jgi:hypothetical protein
MENFNKQNFIKISRIGEHIFRNLYINIKDQKTYIKINILEPLSVENLKETEFFKDSRDVEFYNDSSEYVDSKSENNDYNNLISINFKSNPEIYCHH